VRRAAEQLCGQPNVPLIEVGYPELVFLLSRCHFVVTDPGGIQEEAPPFGKPVLVTRDTTERPEAMELGLAMLVGTDVWRLFDEMTRLLDDNGTYSRMSLVENPYGRGHASRRTANRLVADAAENAPATLR
jgi:UDP-N-acetylglucosamine 2-epimerase (hydrolysing)